MSLFLYYFDDAPLTDLHGRRGAATLNPVTVSVQLDGRSLATQAVSITDGVASEALREPSSPGASALQLGVMMVLFERLARGASPCFFFHVASGRESAIVLQSKLEVSISDLVVRVTRNPRSPSGPGAAAPLVDVATGQRTFAEGETWSLSDLLCSIPEHVLVKLLPLSAGLPGGPHRPHRVKRR